MSYWMSGSDAERYARSRPRFHALVIDRIRSFLKLAQPATRALDIGCGTGQSATALTAIASHVVGLDISRSMLDNATDRGVGFLRASGEYLPFRGHQFDLATVALSFHWLDRCRFLVEAWRVLRPSGWLVIYDNFFYGQMLENPEFEQWAKGAYLMRYPLPPRDSQPLTEEVAANHGFLFVDRETYTNEVSFCAEDLTAYLTTQTNVIAAIRAGKETPGDASAWLMESVNPLFPVQQCTFRFGGYVWYLRPQPYL